MDSEAQQATLRLDMKAGRLLAKDVAVNL